MSTNRNAITPFLRGTPEEFANAIGITQFHSETSWSQTIGGLRIQGDFVDPGPDLTLVIPFQSPYITQLLGVFIQVAGGEEGTKFTAGYPYVIDYSKTGFTIVNGVGVSKYFWWAIGV